MIDLAVHDETDDLLWEIHELLSALRTRGQMPAEKALLITRDLRALALERVTTGLLMVELDRVTMGDRRSVDQITADLERRCAEHTAMVRTARAEKRAERLAAESASAVLYGGATTEAGR